MLLTRRFSLGVEPRLQVICNSFAVGMTLKWIFAKQFHANPFEFQRDSRLETAGIGRILVQDVMLYLFMVSLKWSATGEQLIHDRPE